MVSVLRGVAEQGGASHSGQGGVGVLVLACFFASLSAPAKSQTVLDEVVVSANRQEQQAFDAPAAINSVGLETLSVAGPQVNVSEALSRIPGISASTRNNYAQDPQISIRGFGARAAFGVRGIKLVTDGIPASIPDGQGQASTFALTSTDRIEVLRGPLAVLYGNSSGGVIQAFTREASDTPELSLMAYAGSYGLRRGDVQFSTTSGQAALLGDYSYFETDGYRVNSAAKRTQFNGKYDLKQSEKTQLSFILNVWDQPYAQDPAGLQASDLLADRRRIRNPEAHRVRKITSQEQLGVTVRHEDAYSLEWEGRIYAGQRENLQYQSIFNSTASAWNNSWVGLDRDYSGLGLSASKNMLFADVVFRLTGGLEADYSKERRQGGAATAGEKVAGSLTRDEDNTAKSVNAYVLGTFLVSTYYTVTAGTRIGQVDFDSKDFRTLDGDGSGKIRYSQFSPVLGVTRHLNSSTNLFVNYGRGFETPTLAEVAYASSSSSFTPTSTFNQSIRASKNDQAELGIKWSSDSRQRLSAALFWVKSTDEIVTDQSNSGRTSFKNAPKTRRLGAELSWVRNWSSHWRSLLAATVIDATYDTAFTGTNGTNAVAAGNKIPGIPGHVIFSEIEWAESRNAKSSPLGWSAGVELQALGRRHADDTNTLSADPFESVALRAGFSKSFAFSDFQIFARVDNVFDKKYVGSVIVNSSSPFEPSPLRNWMLGVKGQARF